MGLARSGFNPSRITQATTIYDGPTRGAYPLFQRNVNTHATVALGGIGFDRTYSTLIVDPYLNIAVLESLPVEQDSHVLAPVVQ
ncbi:MAG: aspartate dehydrogenase domain-containing protein [Candidatus Bathyarchaeia archaeon]